MTVYAGNLHAVFAGARMANVGGSSFVHLDGEHASDYILANYVYGGNDIAGTIGTSAEIPTELTEVGTAPGKNKIDASWNAFVRISTKMDGDVEADDAQKNKGNPVVHAGNHCLKANAQQPSEKRHQSLKTAKIQTADYQVPELQLLYRKPFAD